MKTSGTTSVAHNENDRKRIWLVAIIGAASMFADGYDISALGLSIPLLAEDFGMSPGAFGPAASSSLAGMALGAMFISPAGARFGIEKMLSVMLFVIGLSTLGAMFSSGPIELSVWRFICGLGMGAVAPFVVSMTSSVAPPARRTFLVTLVVSAVGFGALAAGFISPVLADAFGWRGIFAVGGIMPLLVGLAAWVLLARGSTAPRTPKPPVTNAQNRFIRALVSPFDSIKQLMDKTYVRITLPICIIWTANMYMNYALISWLPMLLVEADWSLGVASRLTGLLAVGGIVGGLLISVIIDRSRKPRAVMMFAYCLGVVVLSAFSMLPQSQGLWVMLLIVIGLSLFGMQIALSSITAAYYPVQLRAAAVGWCSGFGRIGSVIGPLVLAVLIDAQHSPGSILTSLALPTMLCVISVLVLRGNQQVEAMGASS